MRGTEVWEIPLSYITNNAPSSAKHYFLSKRKDVFDVGDFKWIKFNRNFTGFYKVFFHHINDKACFCLLTLYFFCPITVFSGNLIL